MNPNNLSSIDVLDSYHLLHWLTHLIKPKSYLEVGVREGASLCCALADEPEVIDFVMTCLMDGLTELTPDIVERISECYTDRDPEMHIDIFDNWSYVKDGTGFRIKKLLEYGFNHTDYMIHTGDSKETLPKFFEKNPEKIDLIFIDGDHTLEGATSDLNTVVGKFKVLVFHDLHHPQHNYLDELFKHYVYSNGYLNFTVGRRMRGVGVAFDLS